jgi:hypothetical protein
MGRVRLDAYFRRSYSVLTLGWAVLELGEINSHDQREGSGDTPRPLGLASLQGYGTRTKEV